MLELLILWTYMLLLSTVIGTAVLAILSFVFKKNIDVKYSFLGVQLAALCFITFYTQVWSLFGRVYIEAHLLLLFVSIGILICGYLNKNKIARQVYDVVIDTCSKIVRRMLRWEGALFFILILITAYYASRGNQHTDTYIYHAEMIRWYEEYGLVIGMGNLQNHFAYNSAYLGYASFWSMRWLLGQSLHGTNGYIQALLVVTSIDGLLRIKEKPCYITNGARLAIIIYAIVNSEYICSPATDFGALYLVLWIVLLWSEVTFDRDAHSDVAYDLIFLYGLLCIASCIALTYKLSAGMIVIIAIYPAICLLKEKRARDILLFLGLGVLTVLPWVARNILISGAIIYPMDMFRLPFLDWAIPSAVFLEDNSYISTWGKCLYDITRVNDPISVWYPIWWEYKDTYEKMIIISNVLAGLMEIVWIFERLVHKKRFNLAWAIMKFAFLICMIVWFVKAPFIRYSLSFLLLIPLCEIGQWLSRKEDRKISGPISIISGFGVIAIALTMMMYVNYYTLVCVNLAKANLGEPYYISQKDYAQVEYNTYDMDGLTIYYPTYESDNSYAPIPSTACIQMAYRTTLRGTTLEEGFKPAE